MPEQLDSFVSGRPVSHPMVYAYSDSNPMYNGLLKVGFTAIDVEKRVAQQYPTKRPDGKLPYKIVFAESAMYEDGGSFDDHEIHRMLRKKQLSGVGGGTVDDVRAAWLVVKTRTQNVENRTLIFPCVRSRKRPLPRPSNTISPSRTKAKDVFLNIHQPFFQDCLH
jgi:hypothetical protein